MQEHNKHLIIDALTSAGVINEFNTTLRISNTKVSNVDIVELLSKLPFNNMVNKYEDDVARTATYLDNQNLDEMHCVAKLCAEAGELTSTVADTFAYNKADDEVNVFEELGDIMFYIAFFCKLRGWSINDILEGNVRKRKLRYPDGFNAERFANRDKPAEFKMLEEMIATVKRRFTDKISI